MALKNVVKALAVTAGAAVLGRACFTFGVGITGGRFGKALNNMEAGIETENDKKLLTTAMDLDKNLERLKKH